MITFHQLGPKDDKDTTAWFVRPPDMNAPFIHLINDKYKIYSRPGCQEIAGPFSTLEAAKAALLVML